jgi:hypothetical protein
LWLKQRKRNYAKGREITQAEFKQLLMKDSIASIRINDDNPARIYKKPFHENDKPYFLKIESPESFKDSLRMFRKTLSAKNIHPRYDFSSIYSTDGPGFFLQALPLIILLVQLIIIVSAIILFLIAIKDLLKSKFESDIDKLIWFLLVVMVPIIGPLLYIFIGKKQRQLK